MTQPRPNIHELARLSGFSVGTVSRALNGYADVRAETRETILRVAQELDYTPAAAARTLVTQRSHVIGVFLETGEGHPDLQHPFFHEVLGGVKNCIGAAGYDLLLFASERPGNGFGTTPTSSAAATTTSTAPCSWASTPTTPRCAGWCAPSVPRSASTSSSRGPRRATSCPTTSGGAALAVRHLHGLGHRRIATITGLLDKRPGADRLRGYRHELQALRARRARRVRRATATSTSRAATAPRRSCSRCREPPTAIVTASDMTALGAIRAATEAGLRVPEDLSVTGFDDIQLAALPAPAADDARARTRSGLGTEAGRSLLRHDRRRGRRADRGHAPRRADRRAAPPPPPPRGGLRAERSTPCEGLNDACHQKRFCPQKGRGAACAGSRRSRR